MTLNIAAIVLDTSNRPPKLGLVVMLAYIVPLLSLRHRIGILLLCAKQAAVSMIGG